MKNIIKGSLFSALWVALVAQNTLTNAALNFGVDKASTVAWSSETADNAVTSLIGTLATFLSLVAVLYALWWGFNILTAWGIDEKVKTWKKVIIQALGWLVVIWLAYSIVSWLVTLILK
jgi:hypothetical protein